MASSQEIWRDGDTLVVSKHAVLPNICLFTNEPTDGSTVKHHFAWTHPAFVWFGLLLLILVLPLGLLVCAIASPFVNKRAKLRLPVCEKRFARWKSRRHVWLGAIALALALLGACCALVATGADDVAGLVLLASFGVVALGGLVSSLVGWRMKVARIHKHYVWLKGVHPDYLTRFSELPMKA
jgi:hypothetical protein